MFMEANNTPGANTMAKLTKTQQSLLDDVNSDGLVTFVHYLRKNSSSTSGTRKIEAAQALAALGLVNLETLEDVPFGSDDARYEWRTIATVTPVVVETETAAWERWALARIKVYSNC